MDFDFSEMDMDVRKVERIQKINRDRQNSRRDEDGYKREKLPRKGRENGKGNRIDIRA